MLHVHDSLVVHVFMIPDIYMVLKWLSYNVPDLNHVYYVLTLQSYGETK